MANNTAAPISATPPLLALPAELRNHIYSLVLILPVDQYIEVHRGLREPALLQTCRRSQHETVPIYYGENTFKAEESLYSVHKRHGYGRCRSIDSVLGQRSAKMPQPYLHG